MQKKLAEIILWKSRVQFETFWKESRNGSKILLSLYENFSQACEKFQEIHVIEENCYRHFVENFWKFVEKFSGIFGIILLIFLENLVIFLLR